MSSAPLLHATRQRDVVNMAGRDDSDYDYLFKSMCGAGKAYSGGARCESVRGREGVHS